jgi:hypothetical protein
LLGAKNGYVPEEEVVTYEEDMIIPGVIPEVRNGISHNGISNHNNYRTSINRRYDNNLSKFTPSDTQMSPRRGVTYTRTPLNGSMRSGGY